MTRSGVQGATRWNFGGSNPAAITALVHEPNSRRACRKHAAMAALKFSYGHPSVLGDGDTQRGDTDSIGPAT